MADTSEYTQHSMRNQPAHLRVLAKAVWVGDCLEFRGSRNNKGYGVLSHNGRKQLAHRVIWESVNGPISEGLCVCHTCDNPICVHIDHLWLGTHKDNMQDMVGKGRRVGWQSSRTHCPQGHPYDDINTYNTPNGHRACRECMRIRSREWKERRRTS